MINTIYEELQKHEGKENAISAQDLAYAVGLNGTRELRGYIHKIRMSEEFEKVVLSGNRGYFIGRGPEVRKCVNRLLGHAFDELRIGKTIQKKAGMDGQGKLVLKQDEVHWVESLVKNARVGD
jgi:hypothetical protein